MVSITWTGSSVQGGTMAHRDRMGGWQPPPAHQDMDGWHWYGWMDGTKRASSTQRGRHFLCEIGSGAWETFANVVTDERQHR